jgi:copper homeostasis protein (lipoprotein)
MNDLRCLPRKIGRAVLLLACLWCWEALATGYVNGAATHLGRMALPFGAVFEAVPEDVSNTAEASPEVIEQFRIEPRGNLPVQFAITYDPASISPNRRYSVWAHILVGGWGFFIKGRPHSVLPSGRGNGVDLELRQTSSAPAGARTDLLGGLPASFIGDLPCADCPGIRYQVELFPDWAFFLRTTYLGRLSFDEIGTWAIARDQGMLVLWGGREAPLKLAIKDANRLRKLDVEGREIASSLNYDLKRAQDLQPLEPRVVMRGMYKYLANTGWFTECQTGKSWPVVQDGDNAALVLAYSKARRQPGDELLASLHGRIALQPRSEGQQPRLVVERFMRVWPGETCGAQLSTPSLGNTYWKLTRLGDTPVAAVPQQREPHFILHSESRRVSGSSGCNRLMGRYELKSDTLAFDQMAATKMACPQGMDLEKTFLEALGQVKTWKITGQHLDLFDAAGKPVARLEASYVK